MRLLAVKRYSGEDEAGAMDRQHSELERYALDNEASTLHWVEDETVSGSINLDQRKELGQWLTEPLLYEWDVMAVTTQDRITRDDMHWWQFVGNLIEWGKHLVVLDDPQLDLSTPNGRMIAGIKATQAANYRLDVKNKARKARESFREQRRYAGGHWPYGHRAVPREDGNGWRLVKDPETAQLVQEAVNRILQGDSLRGVVKDWTERGVPTAREHQRATYELKPGEVRPEPKHYAWNETSLKRVLLSPSLLGYASYKGEMIREDGLPVQWSEPIITNEEYLAVQEILRERGGKRAGIRTNRSPFLGIAFCWCGRQLHLTKNRGYEYYRCGSVSRGTTCEHAKLWPVNLIEDYFEERFLFEVGDEEIKTRSFIPGQNRSSEIGTLKDAIDNLSGNLADLPSGSRAAKTTMEKIASYEEQLDKLEAEPIIPSAWSYKSTGITFREKWEKNRDWRERGKWILQCGIKAYFGGSPQVPQLHLEVPEDLLNKAQDAVER